MNVMRLGVPTGGLKIVIGPRLPDETDDVGRVQRALELVSRARIVETSDGANSFEFVNCTASCLRCKEVRDMTDECSWGVVGSAFHFVCAECTKKGAA
jgi:hypothetical protein